MANPNDIDPRDTNYVPPALLKSGLVGPNAMSLLGTKDPLTDRELLVKWLAIHKPHGAPFLMVRCFVRILW